MERAARRRDSRRWAELRAAFLAAAAALVAAPVAAQVNVNSFDLPPGASVTITFDVDVDNPLNPCASSISNQGTVTATNHANVLTDDTAVGGAADPTVTPLDAIALAITKTDGAASEVPGTPVTYTIVASNAGPTTAFGVTVADDFPAILTGCSTASLAAGGATGNDTGMAGDFVDGGITLPSGASITYTATCNIDPAATGNLANTATIAQSGTQIECNTADNSATDTDTLTPQADVAITKTNNVTNVDAGGSTTYVIVASNAAGPSTAAGVTITDNFDFTKLASCSTTSVAAGGATGNDAGPFAGNISDGGISLPVGATVTYTSVCSVLGTATGTLSNTATISTSASDPNGGNNSATDGPDTINPLADLSITKTDGVTTAVPGMSVTYTITASNAGPATATGATVTDTFPASLTCSWTCVGVGGGTCTAGPVAGNIADSVNLPSGGSATYTAVCQIANNASGSLVNTATIGGGGVTDNTPGNNSATDTDTLLTLDFGDLPDPTYPTLLASSGARHGNVAGFRLGAQLDAEADGQPTANADGDDLVSGPNVDDEDGVTMPASFVACESTNVPVNASAIGRLDVWVDWNDNGVFDLPAEEAVDNLALVAGPNSVSIQAPCTAVPTAQTFARFRFSTAGNLLPTGVAADGEVEDYAVGIVGLDFGDAPAPYPTLLANGGARHRVLPGPVLGVAPDTESDGQPTPAANGDDATGTDDEDGVTFTTPFARGQSASITVVASAPGALSAWFDWNGDGNWSTAGDETFSAQIVVAGPNVLNFVVPATATPGAASFARFRVVSSGVVGFTGPAVDGEVEDYTFSIVPEADLSITKTDGVTGEVPGTPVTYTIVALNNGPNPATGVTVTDSFPAVLSGCTTTSIAAGGATGNDTPIAGDINDSGITLPVGASVTYTATCNIDAAATGTLVNTATVSSAVADPVPGNNSATDTDTLGPEADLAITKTDGAATEIPGTPVTYTIVASNAGPSNATATVADTFPAILSGVTWSCVGAGGGICTSPGSGDINAAVTLPSGGSVTYTATGTISAAATGTLSNTATVTATGGASDPVPGNNSATDTDTLTPEADLQITKTDGSLTEVPGTPVTYTIVVTNAGPSNAVGAAVADTFPGIVTGVSWSCVGAGGATCTAGGSGNISDTANVPVGGSATYTATGAIASSATGTLANTATVTAPGGTTDPNGGNNSATDTDTLTPEADLQITKDDSADPPPAGQDLVYTITVENLGPSDATSVVVTDPLPAEVTYVSDDCGASNVPPWTWNVGSLIDGATATCNVTVSINPTPPASISNTATVASATTDPVAGNNSDTELTQLDAVPPTVENVDSQGGSGDGTLDDCESVNATIWRLVLDFDEGMNDPPGDVDADDVTNPANYLVVTPGPDFDFQTTGCGGAQGDDVPVTIAAVTYDDVLDLATLELGGALAEAQHRLFACDTLTDIAGNALDGDGDTNAGGDFLRAFRSDPANLFANGHFDCTLDGWNETVANPLEIEWTGAVDGNDADASGSAFFTNLAPGVDTNFALDQCSPVPAVTALVAQYRVRLDAATGTFIGFTRSCEFFSAPGCGTPLGTTSSSLLLSDTGGGWIPFVHGVSAPAGAQSARCTFRFSTAAGASFDGFLDAAVLRVPGAIFADGFESSDTTAWTATVP